MKTWLMGNRPAVVKKPAEEEPPVVEQVVVESEGTNLRTVAAVAQSEVAEKKKQDKTDRVGRQFHFRKSETDKS